MSEHLEHNEKGTVLKHHIAIIGLSHKTSSIELRESVSFTGSQLEDFLKKLKTAYPSWEFVVLSTCNRVEIYAGSTKERIDTAGLIYLLASCHSIPTEDISPYVYILTASEAIKHLFEVTAGIDSMVIGETQILGQVKKSFRQAFEGGFTGKVLNRIFQRALAVGKQVRSATRIDEGRVSISSIACQLAEEVSDNFSHKTVLLVGTGKIGTLTLKSLQNKGANTIWVSSRNYNKAERLAEEFQAIAIQFEYINRFIAEADVVISATSAPNFILHAPALKSIMKRRKNKPLFLIDLALPRDIDPLSGHIPGIHLYNIDSLKSIADRNMEKRKRKIFRCKKLIENKVRLFAGETVCDEAGKRDLEPACIF